nr:RecT family recombinase [Brevibacillus laterosporus]
MTTQIAEYQPYAFGELNESDVKTIHETIAKDCNESQFKLFMAIAKSSNANPILGEIHPSVFGGKLTVQFGIDFHVRKAREEEGYLGYDVQLIHEHDEFKMHQERSEDGRYYVVIDEHSWTMPRGRVIGGYAIAYKEGLKPFTVTMEVGEVEHYKSSPIGMQKTMWTKNFNDMFKKHMAKRALKAAFGKSFGDTEDNLKDTISDTPAYEPKQREVVVEVSGEEVRNKSDNVSTTTEKHEEDQINKIKKELKAKFEALGITSKDEINAYMQKHCPIKGDTPNLAELTGLLKIMDNHVAEMNNNYDELD